MGVDVDGDQMISKLEFENMLKNSEAVKVLSDVGVDVLGLVHLTDFIYMGIDNLTFPDFYKLVFSLRGNKQATVSDMVDLRKFIVQELSSFQQMVETDMCSMLQFMKAARDSNETNLGIKYPPQSIELVEPTSPTFA